MAGVRIGAGRTIPKIPLITGNIPVGLIVELNGQRRLTDHYVRDKCRDRPYNGWSCWHRSWRRDGLILEVKADDLGRQGGVILQINRQPQLINAVGNKS